MLTIFTPTYNRKNLLPRLYESLYKQNNKNFEWILVDDGSIDGTEEYVHKIEKENKVQIVYIKQKNSGKHAAHNRAVQVASGDIFLCVDSDDLLADECVVDRLLCIWEKHSQNEKCAGIISYKGLLDGTRMGDEFPEHIEMVSPIQLTSRYHSIGERSRVYRLEYLKEIPYPIISGEKFFPDSYIDDYFSKKYAMALIPRIDTLCEYQSDGLSGNFANLMKKNPKGFCIANMQLIDLTEESKDRVLTACRFWAFKFLARDKTIKYVSSQNRILVKICFLPGMLWGIYYKFRL